MSKVIYKVYTNNGDIKELFRVAMFSIGNNVEVEYSVDFRKQQDLHLNFFHPVQWDVGVILMLERIERCLDSSYKAKDIVDVFRPLIDRLDLFSYGDLEELEAKFYIGLGRVTYEQCN